MGILNILFAQPRSIHPDSVVNPAPSISQSRWNLISNLSLAALRQSGNGGGFTYVGTNFQAGAAYDLASGSAASLGIFGSARFTHIGGRSYTSIADINGIGVGLGLRTRIRLDNFANLDTAAALTAHYFDGVNQLPGLPYSSNISGLTWGVDVSLGILFNLGSSGFSFGPHGLFSFNSTSEGQNAFHQNFDNTFLGVGGGLSFAYTPSSTPPQQASIIQVIGATICAEAGRTPESMRARIEELRPEIAGLRQENTRLRTAIHERYPTLNLDTIAGFEAIADSENDETRTIPADCDSLNNLLNNLENRADQLAEQNARLDGIRYGLGNAPASAIPTATRAITRLQEIHFATARPQGLPDRVSDQAADIENIQMAVQNYLSSHTADANGNRQPLALNEIENTFRGIFVRTRRHDDNTEFSPSVEVIRRIAEDLRSGDLRSLHFYIVGNTDTRGNDAMNGRLSLRRAEAIRAALTFFGVNPERLHALGRGETNTVYYYDQRPNAPRDPHRITRAEISMLRRDGIRGPIFNDEVALRLVTNRRVEMFICSPTNHEDAVCEGLAHEFQAAQQASNAASATPPSAHPVQTIPASRTSPAPANAPTAPAPLQPRPATPPPAPATPAPRPRITIPPPPDDAGSSDAAEAT